MVISNSMFQNILLCMAGVAISGFLQRKFGLGGCCCAQLWLPHMDSLDLGFLRGVGTDWEMTACKIEACVLCWLLSLSLVAGPWGRVCAGCSINTLISTESLF